MSYMGLFWETGMPEAWALSRKSGDGPESGPTSGSWPDLGAMAPLWPQNMLDGGVGQVILPHAVPWDDAGRPGPKPDGEETKG